MHITNQIINNDYVWNFMESPGLKEKGVLMFCNVTLSLRSRVQDIKFNTSR